MRRTQGADLRYRLVALTLALSGTPYRLLVQVHQTGQVIVTGGRGLVGLGEQLLSTLGEGDLQAAVTGLVGQEGLVRTVAGLGNQGEGVLAGGLVGGLNWNRFQ